MQTFKSLALLAITTLPLSVSAFADKKVQTFAPAYIGGKQVDWCLKFGSKCGKPAADAFCKKKGFETATAYKQDTSPAIPTIVLGTGEQCTEEGNCTGLISVTCAKQTQPGNLEEDVGMNPVDSDGNPVADSGDAPLKPGDKLEGDLVVHVYNNPQWKGAALDLCKVWGDQCGKPAANAFCQEKGFANSTVWQKGKKPQVTRVITTGEVCSDDSCRAITYVKCVRSKNA